MTCADPLAAQLDALTLRPGRPVVICDADEVLLQFVAALERFLDRAGYELNLESYALFGNIRERAGGALASREAVAELIAVFFAEEVAEIAPAPGAAAALAALSAQAQVVVLTNIPPHLRAARAAHLARHGMAYPVVANSGGKGRAVAEILRRAAAPAAFLDDGPNHLESVARHAPAATRIHFIADPRVAAVATPSPHAALFTSDWAVARDFLETRLFPA